MSITMENKQPERAQPEEARKLLGEIDRHLDSYPMGRAYFALKAAGYSTFITRLEGGFGAKPATRKRVRAYITAREKVLSCKAAQK